MELCLIGIVLGSKCPGFFSITALVSKCLVPHFWCRSVLGPVLKCPRVSWCRSVLWLKCPVTATGHRGCSMHCWSPVGSVEQLSSANTEADHQNCRMHENDGPIFRTWNWSVNFMSCIFMSVICSAPPSSCLALGNSQKRFWQQNPRIDVTGRIVPCRGNVKILRLTP